ncbi:MAG: hypothetical protein PVG39_05505 [Desulfobacteraceae bacterium]
MRNTIIALILIFLGLPGWATGAGKNTDADSLLRKEIENLKNADVAWRNNDSEFREMRKQGEASETEVREFAEFVAELKRKVIEGCEAVRQLGGDAREHGVDCVEILEGNTAEGGMASSEINELSVPVDESELYKEKLKKLENDFDDMILQAQDELQKKKYDVASNSSSGSGNKAGGQNSGNSQTPGSSGKNKGESKKNGGTGSSAGGSAGSPGSESMGADGGEQGAGVGDHKPGQAETFEHHEKGDSRDDDVVARQLREAAEKETDTVLKEQLWKEYEKYKKSKSQ